MWFDVVTTEGHSDRPEGFTHCRTRAGLLFSALLLGFLGLIGRLYYLQCVRHEDYAVRARHNQTRVVPLAGNRGTVCDRNGCILATSLPVDSIFADPFLIDDNEETASKLAPVVGIDRKILLAKLDKGRRFVWVRRRVSKEMAKDVLSLRLAGIEVQQERTRTYPRGSLACHILGLVDIDGNGQNGIEAMFNSYLKATPGSREIAVDGSGKPIYSPEMAERPPRAGLNVILTIDAVIQAICEEELDATVAQWTPPWACATVMDPRTGEILAMASRPGFDLNDSRTLNETTRRNHAIEDRIEPGSVFKPIVISGALEKGIVEPTTRIFCHNGLYHTGGRDLHDHHPYGWLTVHEVIVNSSNIGAAVIGQMMGVTDLYNLVRRFEFGQRTGLGLAGESSGWVNPYKTWSNYSLTSVPMGHEIGVTPIQMIRAFGALAAGGVLPTPRIARGIVAPDGTLAKSFEEKPKRVIEEKVCTERMRDILEDVVKSGTGKKAACQRYTVAGKTGTTQMINDDGSYSHTRFISSFVGFAPSDRPRVIVMVIVAEPRGAYYGGTVSAPAVGKIIERTLVYLGVPEQPKTEVLAGKPPGAHTPGD